MRVSSCSKVTTMGIFGTPFEVTGRRSFFWAQVKSQNGDLMQWEFGPVGGDSTLGRKAEATAAGLLRNPFVRGGKPRRQPAEIREAKVFFHTRP